VNERLREALEEEDGSITLPHEIMAGGGAGFCQVIATNPMEIGTPTDLGPTPLTPGAALTRLCVGVVCVSCVCRVCVVCVSCVSCMCSEN
jgi:hypothetical protein